MKRPHPVCQLSELKEGRIAYQVDLVGKTYLDYLVGNFCLVDLAVGIVGRIHLVGSTASMCEVADRAAAAENKKDLIRLQK